MYTHPQKYSLPVNYEEHLPPTFESWKPGLTLFLFSVPDGEVAGSIEKKSLLESGMLYLAETIGHLVLKRELIRAKKSHCKE